MALVLAFRNRGITRDITILDADGNTITPGASDEIRAIIGHEGKTPKLTVTSATTTVNGSSFTKGETNRLRLDAQDLIFEAGVYQITIELLDDSDAADWKNIDRQVFSLQET